MSIADYPSSRLCDPRECAGISVRELARQLDIHHTNIVYWQKAGRVAKVGLLLQLAVIFGVSLEEVRGHPRPKRSREEVASH